MLFTILGWIIVVLVGLSFIAFAGLVLWWSVSASSTGGYAVLFAMALIGGAIFLHYAYVNSPFEIALRAVP